jgi:uncharacterized membrane protein YkvA (DUF1232 family)
MSNQGKVPFFARFFSTAAGYLKLLFRRDTPWQVKLMLGAALVYLISPYDFLPDWLLGLGIVDDFAVVSLLVWLASRFLQGRAAPPDAEQEK